ncbi:putative membrane protein [Synechococcus sp. SYN20]|nr:putative membrane protein [Synechococcus sp. SYN20]
MGSQRAALLLAVKIFLIKIAIYWFAELVVCQLDGSRLICKFIGKGFLLVLLALRLWTLLFYPRYAMS